MAIGFASVTTTLYINGSAKISSNNDFKVYYSDAFVNDNQDLSVVVDETHLSFSTTLDTLGESYVLDYDVTNGSKNYDADLEMVCTGGNEWLTVTNEFDDPAVVCTSTDTSYATYLTVTDGGALDGTTLDRNASDEDTLTVALKQSYVVDTAKTITYTCTIAVDAVEAN